MIDVWASERISEELNIYILKTFPVIDAVAKHETKSKKALTKRKARRADYARTQRAWTKNPGKCIKTILKALTTDSPPTKEAMTNYWLNMMTNSVDKAPPLENKQPPIRELWMPITSDEIKKAFPDWKTSPGPDGMTTRQLRAVPLEIITRIFNLFLLCGRLPQHLLKAKTTLIPKKDGAHDPSHYRPITVASVMTRAFHKVLATRLTNLVALDPRQKAFLPKDGCAENIFNLDLILKYHRQQFKPLYTASMDIAKAFDSVSHITIHETLRVKGVPNEMISYVCHGHVQSQPYSFIL